MEERLEREVNQLHASICQALADPKRILILYELHEGSKTVTELTDALRVPQPTVSRHLKMLREQRLVYGERDGVSIRYSLADARVIDALDTMRAVLIGDVTLGARCWIGPGARLRGDYGSIVLGDCCAVEDNCIVHARPGETCTIGSWVTLGHGCVVHNVARLGDYAVIGMGAVVSDWAEVGEWGVIAEGAVVPQRAVVPAASIAAGVPARLLDRAVDDDYKTAWRGFKQIYVDLCERYRAGFGA